MLKRFGVSLERELLDEFDKLIKEEGYTNRSEAIRDLIRDNLVQKEWAEGDIETAGVALIVYNHHKLDLAQRITNLQHHSHDFVVATLHIHLDTHP